MAEKISNSACGKGAEKTKPVCGEIVDGMTIFMEPYDFKKKQRRGEARGCFGCVIFGDKN